MTKKEQNLEKNEDNSLLFEETQVEKNIQLEVIFKKVCASLGDHLGEEFLSHIILVLKLEGIIGKEMGKNDIKMVNEIKEKLINDKDMKEELLDTIKKIKRGA